MPSAKAAARAADPPQAQSDSARNGPRFLVRLNQGMNTGREKQNQRFDVRTLEALETANGYIIPSQVVQATAGGAAMGSAAGISAHDSKAAARGAAEGGVAAFLAASGLGQDLDLPKGVKLELVLDRPLFIVQ